MKCSSIKFLIFLLFIFLGYVLLLIIFLIGLYKNIKKLLFDLNMEVILLETFDRLGKIRRRQVKDGFARNFLIPQKKRLEQMTLIKTILLELKVIY